MILNEVLGFKFKFSGYAVRSSEMYNQINYLKTKMRTISIIDSNLITINGN